VLVVVVRILGGLRVTGTFTFSSSPEAMTPSVTLAVVHGVLGPAFFGLMIALAILTSPTWTGERTPTSSSHAPADRTLAVTLTGIVLVQLILGAIQRHLSRGLLVHITFAVVVLVMTLVSGARLWGLYRAQPLIERIGKALLILGSVQVVLGFLAFFTVEARIEAAPRAGWEVLLTTAHQAGGSVLLACTVMAALWTRRLLVANR
jgi:cytochrome c oxidase assembly protein subunit 15